MEKSDIKELRKAVKSKESVIDWVYGLYVNSENEVVFENISRLSDMDEDEKFRHMTMFGRILNPNLGRDNFPILIDEQQGMLLSLRGERKELQDFEEFRDLLLANFEHTDPYYAAVARIVYDVPTKTKDRRTLDDSEYVYESLLCCICPSKLSAPSLGLADDRVRELDRRWTIGNPKRGFVYPAFNDRMEDRNQVLIFSKEPDNEDFFRSLFKVQEDLQVVGAKTQKNLFSGLLTQLNIGVEDAAAISEGLVEHAAEEESGDILTKTDLKRIAESAGVKVDDRKWDESYDDSIGDTPLAVDALADKHVTVKTDSVMIKMPYDKASLIATRTIDGRDYLLIPADGAIEVNGAVVSAGAIGETVPEDKAENAARPESNDASHPDAGKTSTPAKEDTADDEEVPFDETDQDGESDVDEVLRNLKLDE